MPRPDRRAAAAAATDFLAALQWSGLPVDPFELAKRANITVEPIDTGDFSGCLLRQGDRFGIFYSTAIDNEGFRRFTVSHEIGHGEQRHHHEHLFQAGAVHASRSNFISDLWYEQEADAFAAELLMPEAAFQAEMRKQRIGLPAVKAFAGTFLTSLTSTAIRYATLSPDPVAVIVSADGIIQYCFGSSCMRKIRADYIKKGTPVPPSSQTFKMIKSGAVEAEGSAYLSAWFDRPERELKFAEDVIDLGRYGRVMTVLHAVEVPDPETDEDDDTEEQDKFNRDGKRVGW